MKSSVSVTLFISKERNRIISRNYRIDLSYLAEGWPIDDQKYEKIVGRSADGSGMGMGERDMSRTLSSKSRALAVFNKLVDLRDNYLLRVTLSMVNE